MSVRAIQSRVVCDAEILRHLWRTHRVFNERLPKLLGILFKMRRGDCGQTEAERNLYQRVGRFITAYSSQNADYLMNSISMRSWKPASAKKYSAKMAGEDGTLQEITGASWADEAAALSAQGKLLFDKEDMAGDLPGPMRQMLSREAVAIISGHDELTRNWEQEHKAWLARKADWERDPEHQKYLALRHRFGAFEIEAAASGGHTAQQAGRSKVGKRRGRWHLYLAWLKSNPDLAAWRGGPAIVNEPGEEALKRIRRAKPWKTRSVEAEEFWNVNPELKVLDRLHGYYEKEFVRSRKTKRNEDGFDHRPTFTLPDAVRHPRWFVFNAPQTNPAGYRNLRLPSRPGEAGSVELCLLTGDKADGEYPCQWVQVRFKADPRLAAFRAVLVKYKMNKGKNKGQEKEKEGYVFHDRHLRRERPATIGGLKLIFRGIRPKEEGSLESGAAYLVFTCDVESEGLTERAKAIKLMETGEKTKRGKARRKRVLPEGLVSCAVDLGVRHLGFTTLARKEGQTVRVVRSRNIGLGLEEKTGKHVGRWSAGPDLAHIGQHKRELRQLRRQRGNPVKGEASHTALQEHIDGMSEDRFKKAARAIINFALNTEDKVNPAMGQPYPRADVLVLENMEKLIPDAEKERGINRMLVGFNRGNLVKRVEEMAKDVGLRVILVSPMGTSQVCSKCGALGRRYSIRKKEQGAGDDGPNPEIHFGLVEKLFACPSCGYRANADHNASVNLHRRLHEDEGAIESYLDYLKKTETQRREALAEIEGRLLEPLRRLHRLERPALETPF